VLRLNPKIAPVKIAILPIVKKLSEEALKVFNELSKSWNCEFDETGNVGKRYFRFDEIGCPYCVVVDSNTTDNGTVTVRDRDTGLQDTVTLTELKEYFRGKLDD
jgi:glycyl-tRNA synthetase